MTQKQIDIARDNLINANHWLNVLQIDDAALRINQALAILNLEARPKAESGEDRYWCSEGCGFVEQDHRCEQWSQLAIIPKGAIAALLASRQPTPEKDARELAENIIPMPFVGRWSAQNYTAAITAAAAAIERYAQARAESAEADLHLARLEIDARKRECQTVTRKRNEAEGLVKGLRAALEAIAAKEQQKAIHYYQDSFGELMNVDKLEAGGFKMGSTERLLRHTLRDCGDIARAALAKAKGEKD